MYGSTISAFSQQNKNTAMNNGKQDLEYASVNVRDYTILRFSAFNMPPDERLIKFTIFWEQY